MKDIRFVCQYPQGKYCGNYTCRLSEKCSVFPIIKKSFRIQMKYGKRNKINCISKSDSEKKQHAQLYEFYNRLFGNLRDKKIQYSKKYYQKNREKILRNKKRQSQYQLSIVQKQFCNGDCYNCLYEDCIIPIWNNNTEYHKLYYEVFKEKLNKQKAEYQKEHRAYLSNSEKLRNYKKKGYIMSQCILKETTHPDYEKYEGTCGVLTTIQINGNDYISFISIDKEFSLRAKIEKN